MTWINWVSLGSGLGIGTVLGWWLGRSRPVPISTTISEPIQPDQTPLDQTSPDQTLDQLKLDQLKLDQLKLDQLKLKLAYLMAKETGQFKAGFLTRTSHELRSPINSVISLHQLILSDLCENHEEEREFVAQANVAAQKMLTVLDQLIKVSKADYSAEGSKVQPVSLEDVLLEVQQFVALQAKNRNLRLDIVYPEPDIDILADRDWLRQVLVNLIDTPITLMQEGTVQVATEVNLHNKEVYIDIQDERPIEFWMDEIDWLDQFKVEPDLIYSDSQTLDRTSIEKRMKALNSLPSPGLMLLVDQTILELMGGHLELRSIPSSQATTPDDRFTRIRCVIRQG